MLNEELGVPELKALLQTARREIDLLRRQGFTSGLSAEALLNEAVKDQLVEGYKIRIAELEAELDNQIKMYKS